MLHLLIGLSKIKIKENCLKKHQDISENLYVKVSLKHFKNMNIGIVQGPIVGPILFNSLQRTSYFSLNKFL